MQESYQNTGLGEYTFCVTPLPCDEACTWHFLALPKALSAEIRADFKHQEEGWGRMKVHAKIGNTAWSTSIFYDTKHGTYLMPLKSEVRKKEKIDPEKPVTTAIRV